MGCPIPGWNLCAASSIVMEVDSGQPLPNGNQPMMWLILSGTITAMVTIKGKSHIAGYHQKGDIFLNTTPHEFSELLGLPANHQILESPLALARQRGLAKENSIIVGTPIRLLSALGKRHPEWHRFSTVALLRLVAYHMHREYQLLTMSTEERYLAFTTRSGAVPRPDPRRAQPCGLPAPPARRYPPAGGEHGLEVSCGVSSPVFSGPRMRRLASFTFITVRSTVSLDCPANHPLRNRLPLTDSHHTALVNQLNSGFPAGNDAGRESTEFQNPSEFRVCRIASADSCIQPSSPSVRCSRRLRPAP